MSNIEWTDETLNLYTARPRKGGPKGWHCARVSPGCLNCYAARLNQTAGPLGGTGLDYTLKNQDAVLMRYEEQRLEKLERAKKSRMVFVNSMTDTFGEFIPNHWILEILERFAANCRQHFIQILTKRAGRMQALVREWLADSGRDEAPEHMIFMVSAEDEDWLDRRLPLLLDLPVRRGLSIEPQLGPVTFANHRDAVEAGLIDWVIQGGESGPGARPFDFAWCEPLRKLARKKCFAWFLKQAGSHPVLEGEPLTLKHKKGGDPAEWPILCQPEACRQYPVIPAPK